MRTICLHNRFVAIIVAATVMAPVIAGTLNEASGKLFDVNLEKRTARFLKQDVTYDPDTGQGTAWYIVRWTEKTSITSKTRLKNFKGIKTPMLARFRGIDKGNMAKLIAGKAFVANSVFLYPDGGPAIGIDKQSDWAMDMFTATQANDFRSGHLLVDGKKVPVTIRRGGKRIVMIKELSPAVLAQGFWKATVTGTETNGEIAVDEMVVETLADPRQVDDPKLPRVLSVGDSISINYMNSARENLKGIANYHRIEDNCWSTHRGKAFMAYWLGDYKRKGLGWDVILFNSGMHDLKQKVLGGPYAVPVEEYKKNLRKEIELMKPTGATLIFVTTTPVPNDLGNAQYAFRSKGSEKDFNAAAREVLKDFPEIRILDLAKVVHESTEMDNWRKGKDVHYWKESEQTVLGKAVAEAVKAALPTKE